MTRLARLFAFTAVAAVAAPALAADKYDNPEYKSWAQYKPGTSIVTRLTVELSGATKVTTTTTTLVEVTKDEVVVESTGVITEDGREVKLSPKRSAIPQQVNSLPPSPKESAKKVGPFEEGKKKVKVGDTEFECEWVKSDATVVVTETFSCDSLPGIRVKNVMKTEDGHTTTEVIKATLKK